MAGRSSTWPGTHRDHDAATFAVVLAQSKRQGDNPASTVGLGRPEAGTAGCGQFNEQLPADRQRDAENREGNTITGNTCRIRRVAVSYTATFRY